ncbi:MAG: hypothetical protein ABSE81_02575 [Candidatus Omnitrophota bacterium]
MLVLGNGATMGAKRYPIEDSWRESLSKMPSAKNFFYDLFLQKKTDVHSERLINSLGMTYEGTNNFLVYGWGLKNNIESFEPKEWENINIEEVFTFLDVGEKMLRKGDRYGSVFSKAKKSLIDFITLMLTIRCEGQHCEHLISLFSKLKPRDTIISFNWDTIADTTLAILKTSQFKNYIRIMKDKNINIEQYKRRGLFLKLHGSFNWIVCQNRQCKSYKKPALSPLTRNRKFPGFASKNSRRCQSCGQEKTAIGIIPPVSNKLVYQDNFLHKLWLLTREKLAYTKRIVFIGYSFPPTDFYTEWLFRQIHYYEDANFEIDVVNPEMFKRGSLIPERYKSIFRNFKMKSYHDLAEYVENFKSIRNS